MNTMWQTIGEGVEYMGNMLLGAFDTVMTAASSKMMDVAGDLGTSLSSSVAGMKESFVSTMTPNTISAPGKENTSHTLARSPSPEYSTTSTEKYSAIMQSVGMPAGGVLSSFTVEAADLGGNATVGYDGVGCASYQAPRMAQTQSIVLG